MKTKEVIKILEDNKLTNVDKKKEKIMRPEKKEIEDRKNELQKQHDDLLVKINEGKNAVRNMEAGLIILQGAIKQCNWTLELYKKEK